MATAQERIPKERIVAARAKLLEAKKGYRELGKKLRNSPLLEDAKDVAFVRKRLLCDKGAIGTGEGRELAKKLLFLDIEFQSCTLHANSEVSGAVKEVKEARGNLSDAGIIKSVICSGAGIGAFFGVIGLAIDGINILNAVHLPVAGPLGLISGFALGAYTAIKSIGDEKKSACACADKNHAERINEICGKFTLKMQELAGRATDLVLEAEKLLQK